MPKFQLNLQIASKRAYIGNQAYVGRMSEALSVGGVGEIK